MLLYLSYCLFFNKTHIPIFKRPHVFTIAKKTFLNQPCMSMLHCQNSNFFIRQGAITSKVTYRHIHSSTFIFFSCTSCQHRQITFFTSTTNNPYYSRNFNSSINPHSMITTNGVIVANRNTIDFNHRIFHVSFPLLSVVFLVTIYTIHLNNDFSS